MERGHKVRARALLACLVAVGICAALVGCAVGASGSSSGSGSGGAGSVAATIMGHEIMEDEVTDYIATFRSGMQRTDDTSWVEYLGNAGITPEELRLETIYELASPIIINAQAEELGITVDESAVEKQTNALRSSLLATDDESWQSELERYGMTEEKLRENMASRNLREQVYEQVAGDITPTDEQIEQYISENLAGVATKKIDCVYGTNYTNVYAAMESIEQAASVAEGMTALKAAPEEAGVEYADVGWDINAELTSRMQNVISYLEAGQVADAPLGEGGIYYLFYIEDVYTFPEDAVAANLSDESLRQAVSDLAVVSLQEQAGAEWLRQRTEELITVNDMPRGLPYDVEVQAGEAERADDVELADKVTAETDTEAPTDARDATDAANAKGAEDAS